MVFMSWLLVSHRVGTRKSDEMSANTPARQPTLTYPTLRRYLETTRNFHNWKDQAKTLPCSLQEDSDYTVTGSATVSTPWPSLTNIKNASGNSPPWAKTSPKLPNYCNRRTYYNSSCLESKNYGEKYNAKDREVSDKNINLSPTTAIDTQIVTVKRDSIHPFPQNNLPDAINSLFHPGYEKHAIIHQAQKILLVI